MYSPGWKSMDFVTNGGDRILGIFEVNLTATTKAAFLVVYAVGLSLASTATCAIMA